MERSYSGTDPFVLTHFGMPVGRTALVVIDMQNDFLHPNGWYAKQGIAIDHMQAAIQPTARLVREARARGVPVIWTRHGFRDMRDAGIFGQLRPFFQEGGLRRGSWGCEILEECGPLATDWFVEKQRLSAFFGTNLEVVLRSLEAETVIMCGVLTNQCVAATSKDANFRDFAPIVVREAVGTTLPHLHEPALEMMAVGWCEVRGLDDTLSGLGKLPLVNDPDVWSGRALQEACGLGWWCCGLASMYQASKMERFSPAPGHHGYARALDLISGHV